MSHYVDGFVIPIKKDKLDSYENIASLAGEIWMKHGALYYFECAGDDLRPPLPEGAPEECRTVSFIDKFNLKDDETVLFSFIIFKSRAHRDEVNAKVMEDPDMCGENMPQEMPFDPGTMLYGGFTSLVSLLKD